jgi:hypothetical protein
MGLRIDEFMGLSPAEFDSIYQAYKEKETTRNRESWEQARMMSWAAIRPYAKANTKPSDVMKLPWDKKKETSSKRPAPKSTKERFEQISKKWQ